jgi:hypothetical protein
MNTVERVKLLKELQEIKRVRRETRRMVIKVWAISILLIALMLISK